MQVSSLTVKNPKCPLVFVFAGGESHFKDGSSKAQDGYGALRLSLNTLCERHEVEIKTEGSFSLDGLLYPWLIPPDPPWRIVLGGATVRCDAMQCRRRHQRRCRCRYRRVYRQAGVLGRVLCGPAIGDWCPRSSIRPYYQLIGWRSCRYCGPALKKVCGNFHLQFLGTTPSQNLLSRIPAIV